jgi:hypothetical protein
MKVSVEKKVSECPFRKAVEYTGYQGEKVVLHYCKVGQGCPWGDNAPLRRCYRYKQRRWVEGKEAGG